MSEEIHPVDNEILISFSENLNAEQSLRICLWKKNKPNLQNMG